WNKYSSLVAVICLLTLSRVEAATQEKELLSPDVQASLHSSIINPIEPHLVFTSKEKADAWLKDMSNRLKHWLPDPFLRKRYLTIIQYEATRSGLDPQLVLSVITIESKFNKYAISSSGAQGLMQVMPFWLRQIGLAKQSLFDTQTNIRYGCTILRYYMQREHGNLKRALARYNGSLGQNWYPNLVLNAYNNYWKPYPVVSLKNGNLVSTDYSVKD
ncbi:MAG: transglycosylase SLT domain-containing protein, partial [Burkholderiales bacterium]